MGEKTAISWATDTFNPWWGCRRVSPACRFCYAERDSNRWGFNAWGAHGERRMMSDGYWQKPLQWNRKVLATGEQRRVFCASMADVFEDHPKLGEPRNRLWDLIDATPALVWMLLTKRPENVAEMAPWGGDWPRNVWLGVSAENQRFANERIPLLVATRAVVKFVSAAPLLGPVDPTRIAAGSEQQPDMVYDAVGRRYGVPGRWQAPMTAGVDWVITEGESGLKARPSHPDWFRSLRDQCALAGVAFHHKQNGEWASSTDDDRFAGHDWAEHPKRHMVVDRETGRAFQVARLTGGEVPHEDLHTGRLARMYRVGMKAAGRLLDGELHDAIPVSPVETVVTR